MRFARIAIIALAATTALAADRRRAVLPVTVHFCDSGFDVAGVEVPPEFCIRKFADVPTPRVLLFAPNGDLFVSSPKTPTSGGAPPGAGAIFLFRDTKSDAPTRYTFASGDAFRSVHGLLIKDGRFYYTVADAVYSVPYSPGDQQMSTASPQKIADLSRAELEARWTHSLAESTNGDILVASGQTDNDRCPSPNPRLGSVLRIGAGHDFRGDLVTVGLRDPLYIRCMRWGTCYGAELSGDAWDAFGGTEKLIEIRDGDTFGYPCCVDRNSPNPNIAPAPDCSQVVRAKQTFLLHDTPFGFDWERNATWPQPYRGAFFVGLHGHFGTWVNAGLQWAPVDPDTHIPIVQTTDFAKGFGKMGAIPRVADVVFAPDGRLFFCDDQGGAIYWIAPRALKR
jgi:glucose/arabinose dehydrogenase